MIVGEPLDKQASSGTAYAAEAHPIDTSGTTATVGQAGRAQGLKDGAKGSISRQQRMRCAG